MHYSGGQQTLLCGWIVYSTLCVLCMCIVFPDGKHEDETLLIT